MIRFALGLVAALFISSQASASLIRVDVTGSATGVFSYSGSFDLAAEESLGGGTLDFRDIPLGVLLAEAGSDLVETVISSTGSMLYSSVDQKFSECTGLLKRVCFFPDLGLDRGGSVPIFDVSLNIFSANLAYFMCCAGLSISPTRLFYADDREQVFTIGNIIYIQADPVITGTFTSMQVTVVPGPAALPLLFSALGAFAFLRRRRI
jgi:hypothetical protein